MNLFLNLILAHVVGDFYCQTGKSCQGKRERGLRGKDLYIHALVILVLTWLAAWSLSFWWAALMIGVVHLLIDAGKAAFERTCKMADGEGDRAPIHATRYAVWPFVVDQALHVAVIAAVSWLWLQCCDWQEPAWAALAGRYLVLALALLVCWKPANLLIRHILRYCQVKMMDMPQSNFKSGALIGTVERWLVVVFMFLQQYGAIGFLIAAKSILRFSEAKETEKSEYVLAGTLVSVAIAVACGCMLLAW